MPGEKFRVTFVDARIFKSKDTFKPLVRTVEYESSEKAFSAFYNIDLPFRYDELEESPVPDDLMGYIKLAFNTDNSFFITCEDPAPLSFALGIAFSWWCEVKGLIPKGSTDIATEKLDDQINTSYRRV